MPIMWQNGIKMLIFAKHSGGDNSLLLFFRTTRSDRGKNNPERSGGKIIIVNRNDRQASIDRIHRKSP